MSEKQVSRRKFLFAALILSGSSLLAGSFYGYRRLSECDPEYLTGLLSSKSYDCQDYTSLPFSPSELSTFLSDTEYAARYIGKEYIKEYNINSSAAEILQVLNRSLQPSNEAPVNICALIRNQILDDFRNDSLITINDWVFTQTEARICAVTYLDG